MIHYMKTHSGTPDCSPAPSAGSLAFIITAYHVRRFSGSLWPKPVLPVSCTLGPGSRRHLMFRVAKIPNGVGNLMCLHIVLRTRSEYTIQNQIFNELAALCRCTVLLSN